MNIQERAENNIIWIWNCAVHAARAIKGTEAKDTNSTASAAVNGMGTRRLPRESRPGFRCAVNRCPRTPGSPLYADYVTNTSTARRHAQPRQLLETLLLSLPSCWGQVFPSHPGCPGRAGNQREAVTVKGTGGLGPWAAPGN